ncbi:MAG: hypothetical protein RL119_432 [Actinomycetota bacterium]
MITAFDDFPIHAGSLPVNETGSSDPNHYDRYFFNGYRSDASLYFAVALGLYPNRHIADASFSVIVDGQEQISLHASRRAPVDRAEANEVGPIKVIVLEPLRRHQILVDSPEHALRADLTFNARSGPIQEPHFLVKAGQRIVFDYTRLTQFGHWSGWIELDGQRHILDFATTPGSRDRSWGVRPVGPATDMGAPVGERQFYWLWAPINFPTFATHFDVNEYASGQRWHETGFIIPDFGTITPGLVDSDQPRTFDDIGYHAKWRRGTRWAESFVIDFRDASEQGLLSNCKIELTPLYEFQMLGIGYGHPEWGHGMWKGELEVGYERWSLPVAQPCDPRHLHIQAICRARLGEHEGIGILEQLVVGPHEPSGLTGIIDPNT